MNATKMKEALAARGVDHIDGITDELVARMDWVAALTEDGVRLIKRGLRLAFRATEEFGAREDEDRIARLLEGLEALP